MDRVIVFGTIDGGSIPSGRTKMSKIYFNKLIRDKIPEKLISKNCKFKTRFLDKEEFEIELLKKVEEEASALPLVKNKEDLISEIADVLAVIDEIIKVKNISDEQIELAKKINFNKKGGFDKKIFLHWTDDDNYKTNEITRDEKNKKDQ